jgi:hypothetical protein
MTESNDDFPSWEDAYDIEMFREELERVGILDTTCYGKLKEETNSIIVDLRILAAEEQPDCFRDRENYKILFDRYKERVDELNGRRKKLLEKLKTVAKTKKYIEEGKMNIDLINALVANNQRFLSYDEKMREHIKETKSYISMRVDLFQKFTEGQIAESRRLCEKLESSDDVVDELRMSTHEWMAIEHQSLSFRASRIPTETSSLDGRPGEEREVATIYRCKRCGVQKEVGSDGMS